MKKTLLLLPILFLASLLMGQVETPVTWSFEAKPAGDNTYDLVFKAKIADGWKTYSPFQSYGDDVFGPVPTGIYFDEGDHFETVGKLKESDNRQEALEPLFDNITVAYFKKYATFTQRVRISDFGKPITGYVECMACDAEKCLPPSTEDFSFSLKPTGGAAKTAEPAQAKTENTADTKEKTEDTAPAFSISGTEGALVTDAGTPSGMKEPVQWSFSSKLVQDSLYEVTFTADIEAGWTIYSVHTNPDDGPLPTTFNFEDSDEYQLVGAISESGKTKTGMDPVFKVEVTKFVESPAVFTQQLVALDPTQPVTGYLTYMTCNDAECIPADVDFAINLAAGAGGIVQVDPASGLKAIDQTVPAIRETHKSPVATCGKEAQSDEESSLLWTFVLGFAGGLLALLTPCVFPMIPLTVSFFTKSSQDKATGIRNALIYGLSIIVIYVAIGLLITGIFGATALNALSTNWIANTLFFVIFLFFAFSFFGYYEITLPSSWANKSDAMADRGGLIGIFFMAFTLALVSFSCTGPIIGSALVQSATSSLGPFVVMLGFSSALALPFALFAAFPGWLNSLPRSGGWMNSVKVVLGFLELALALKFLSVADMTMHWGILPYEVFLGAWILVFAAMTAYLFGWIKFPHDSPVKKLSPTRGGFAALSLAFTIYLVTGFMYNEDTKSYNALKLMSGLAPPANYNILLAKGEADESIKAKYPSFTKCANDLDCFKNYEEGVAYAKENDMPILLDFTGYGCVNCRKTEEHIWVEDMVKDKLEQDFVLISLYVDDRKELEETLLSIPRQEKLRNVGNLWADFQIVNFEQNSQPLYVMMSPDEQVLAPPRGYQEGVQDYAEFLECGLNTFQGLNSGAPSKGSKPLGSN
ncbi:cytochrome c biogenesis protein CcdA [Phaeodactylibacter sp.]|uniref:protein-disulfide reductase DsbD family protein n=1 Tax=Phaeodactylibacter sp. TaxID=1940289 RepID=UPI0025D6C643|nr:cytochrome c biogenesis protein CcdA [Phaeodactylibacter sp.]MCI4649236.1 thioredoxin family protein [Phaeodactylibacter sp.]MCI5090375.1 thioredoxin family protein [Phaeodactylibacter sp.]